MTYCERMLSLFRQKPYLRPLENVTSQPAPSTIEELPDSAFYADLQRIGRVIQLAH